MTVQEGVPVGEFVLDVVIVFVGVAVTDGVVDGEALIQASEKDFEPPWSRGLGMNPSPQSSQADPPVVF